MPALILAAGLDPKVAAAMSMGIILPTALASTLTYATLDILNLSLAFSTAVGSFVDSFISSKYIMPRLRSESVRRLFASYVFLVGLYYLWSYFALT